MNHYTDEADQRARTIAERIERMHAWLENQRDGKRFEVWVEVSGRIVWSWERSNQHRAVSAGEFSNRAGLKDFRDKIYAAYDKRRAA